MRRLAAATRFGRCARAASYALAFLALASAAAPTSAQAPVDVTGVAIDARTGQAIGGAVVVLVQAERQTLSGPQGRFRLDGVAAGAYTLRARAFGYRDLEAGIVVASDMGPLAVRMEPAPIVLDELTVDADAEADLIGRVLDAHSGDSVPWANLTLTRGVTERVGRPRVAEEDGTFVLPDVRAGAYLLRVEKLGYVPQFVAYAHVVPAIPLEVRLEPDSALMQGLRVFRRELDRRVESFPYSSWSYDLDRIKATRARDLCDVMRYLRAGGKIVVDDVGGFQLCDGIPMSDIAHINVLVCSSPPRTYTEGILSPLPPPPPRGGRRIGVYTPPPPRRTTWGFTFVYTNAYMQRMARDQKRVMPLVC